MLKRKTISRRRLKKSYYANIPCFISWNVGLNHSYVYFYLNGDYDSKNIYVSEKDYDSNKKKIERARDRILTRVGGTKLHRDVTCVKFRKYHRHVNTNSYCFMLFESEPDMIKWKLKNS